MAKQIKGSEIIEPKHLQEAYEQAVQLKNAYLDADKALIKLATDAKKGVAGVAGGTVAEINAINEAYKKSNALKKTSIEVSQQLKQAEDEEIKAKLRWQEVTRNQKKLLQEQIDLENKELGTLPKLEIANNKLRRERTMLNLETEKGRLRLIEINKEINKNNAFIKANSDLMKQQKLNVGNYGSAVNKLTGILGQLGIAFSAFTVIRDAFKTVVEFEKATASLSAITGATGNELEDLKGKVMDLATSMKISATEATKLFEIVGSQMPQLLKDAEGLKTVAESAVVLSKASGDSVEESTRALANVMNQFSLGADQAERAMNVLAAGSLVGSASITDVSEAMKNFGSVAAGANVSVEESVALIEVLGKFSVTGAEAGTKLRGSLLKLQQAGLGYASGQFDINDALEEGREKLATFGTEMEKDAFLQKTFGAENIATGRILLNNIGLFEEYTKGVTNTNVATEQAATNSDTMATVIKELRAAWENWVIGLMEGNDSLGALKDVLRFVADNLGTIMNVVIEGTRAWLAYKSAITLVNSSGTGLLQMLNNLRKTGSAAGLSIGSIAKGLTGMAGILLTVGPLLWDMVKATAEAYDRTTALESATEEITSRMVEERAEMKLLFTQLKNTNGSRDRQAEIIEQINTKYGTYIKNLDDERLMLFQIEKAYKAVSAQLERKIKLQVYEEKLVDLYKAQLEIQDQIAETGDTMWDSTRRGFLEGSLETINKDIAEVERAMFSIETSFDKISKLGPRAGRPDNVDTMERDFGSDNIIAEREKVSDEVEKIEKEEINRLENNKIEKIEIARETFEYQEYYMVDALVEANKKIAEEERKAIERRKKFAEDRIELARKLTDALIAEVDKQIEAEKKKLSEQEQARDYFAELAQTGNTDAAESVKAEKIAIAKQQLEIERLEKKRRNLMINITALELASQKINNGDSNALGNAGQAIADFIAKLPKFMVGTETTVADALGKPNLPGPDGYIARLDGREMVLNPEQSGKLNGLTTNEITNGAIAYHTGAMGQRVMRGSVSLSDERIVNKLNAVEKAIKEIQIPEHRFNFDEQNKMAVHTIKTANKTIRNHYKSGGLFS